MALGFVVMAFVLEKHHPRDGSLLADVLACEPVHLVAHSLLYGGLAAALATWCFPASTLAASRVSMLRRALVAGGCFVAIAGAQECEQALLRRRLPGPEEGFDLAVDSAAATLGLIAWARFNRGRRWSVARALGLVLHPLVLGPAGVFALTWSALRDTRAALLWTGLATLAVVPVVALWIVGLRRAWYSDRDLRVRAERWSLLAFALVVAALAAWGVGVAQAPAVVRSFTLAGLAAAAAITVATLAGFKVSGHVAVPVGVLALLEASSHRGLWPFALAALAVSWARVREGCHTRREVLGAWGIAGASGLLVRAVG